MTTSPVSPTPTACYRRGRGGGTRRTSPQWSPRSTAPTGWTDGPTAYVAYGDTYSEEVTAATSYGWPVARVEGGHLHHLVEPDAVAAEVVRLLGLLEERS